MEVIARIKDWNVERNLLAKGFNHDLEAAFIIEEVLESFGYDNPKLYSREIVKELKSNTYLQCNGIATEKTFEPTLADKLDAWVDIFVYNVGGLFKLSPNPIEAINKVMDHNDAKGSKTDAAGKIMKDETFVEPDLSSNV